MAEYIERRTGVSIFRAKANMAVLMDAAPYFEKAAQMLEKLPAADVAPVRHGRWQYNTDFYVWCCSECGENPHKGTGVVVSEENLPALCGYTNDDFPVCYGVADKQIWRIEGNPCDMQYRRSDCPLIAVGGLRTESPAASATR